MTPRRTNSGFVLLVTILVVALAAVALVAAGRYSSSQAITAVRAARDLQRRWAATSLQGTLLPLAEQLLADAQQQFDDPQVSVRLTITLSAKDYELVIGDEQAKVNVNALHPQLDRVEADLQIRQLLSGLAGDLVIDLRPYQPPLIGSAKLLPLASFGQVFEQPSPQALIGSDLETDGAAANITCWGDGRLNFRRASRAALLALCIPTLDDRKIDQLLLARSDNPEISLAAALEAIELEDEDRDRLTRILTDTSRCHSLWAIHRDSQRAWYYLAVQTVDEDSRAADPLAFQW